MKNVVDIVGWRLCVGCGVCAYICPEKNIILKDVISEGIRPDVKTDVICNDCSECVKVCPGYKHPRLSDCGGYVKSLRDCWGSVIEIWEGYASDESLRYSGSSGGVASAVALYCLENEEMSGVLHIGSDDKESCKNKTFFSQTRSQILSRTGSRYSPASPCDSLEKIESSSSPCVFMGKPCDIAGLRNAQDLKPELDEKIGLALGIFCAGTPSSKGTIDLLDHLSLKPEDVVDVRYRGKGWPGMFSVRLKGESREKNLKTYMEAWDFVEKYRPYRCYLCPDGTSEFADISFGDPWYRTVKEDKLGYSLVLVRTEKGRKILHKAINAGFVTLEQVPSRLLKESQANLLAKRKAIWGRLLAMKMFFIPTPIYGCRYLKDNWLSLSFKDKARSVLGTVSRIVKRGYYRPLAK